MRISQRGLDKYQAQLQSEVKNGRQFVKKFRAFGLN